MTGQYVAGNGARTMSSVAMLHTVNEVRTDTDRMLGRFYAQRTRAAEQTDPAVAELWRAMTLLAFAGGKRLRPYLAVLSYEMYGGTEYDSFLPAACAQELLHLSLLIHDDITDNDTVRHGIDNIVGQYRKTYAGRGVAEADAHHYAESAALLAGDLLLSAAHDMVLRTSFPAETRLASHGVMTDAVSAVGAGQLLDMEASFNEVLRTDTFKIARLKTSSYSFICPLKTGAVSAAAPEGDLPHLESLGLTAGLAFQLADDLLGVFGDEITTGKSNLTDLQEGKRTYLMQLTFEKATDAQRAEIEKYFGRHDLDDRQADIIRGIITDCGARQAVEDVLESQRQEAEKLVMALHVPEAAQLRLRELITKITRRDK